MNTIALVLDPVFGKRVEGVAQQMPVWILSSPLNDAAVAATRHQFKDGVDLTSFMPLRADDAMASCAQALYDIDEHHGTLSSARPYDALLVFGAGPTDLPRYAMEELGLVTTECGHDAVTLRKRAVARLAI